MKDVKIHFKDTNDMIFLAEETEKLQECVDCIKGHYTVNAKSFLGIMSLDSLDCILRFHDDENNKEEYFKKIRKLIKEV